MVSSHCKSGPGLSSEALSLRLHAQNLNLKKPISCLLWLNFSFFTLGIWVLSDYSETVSVCVLGLLLIENGEPQGRPGIKSGSAICKAPYLLTIVLFWSSLFNS